MPRRAGKARVDEGDWEDVYEYEPENRSFFSNPQAQQNAHTMLNMGLAGYRAVRDTLGTIPNPKGDKMRRAWPWAAASGAAFLLAGKAGRMKRPVQVAGALACAKAIFEILR